MANITSLSSKIDKLYAKYVSRETIVTRVVDKEQPYQTKEDYLQAEGLENEQVLLVTIRV